MLTKHGYGRLFLALLMVGVLIIFGGCPDNENHYPTPERTYGPPLKTILFMDEGGLVGTIDPGDSTEAYYWRTTDGDYQYKASWAPTSTSERARILVQPNEDYSSLRVYDQDGSNSIVADMVYLGAYAWSPAASRIIAVRYDGAGQELNIYQKSGTDVDYDYSLTIRNVEEPWEIDPSVQYDNVSSQFVLFSLINTEDATQSKIEMWDVFDQEIAATYTTQAISPKVKYDDGTGNRLAYIDGADGEENATTIHLLSFSSDGFNLRETYDFSAIGTGAATLSWSTKGEIALFVNVYGGTPKLVVIMDEDEAPMEVPVSLPIVLPDPTMLHLAAPAWAPVTMLDERLVALTVEEEDGLLAVMTVNVITGEENILVDNLDSDHPFIPDWRLLEN